LVSSSSPRNENESEKNNVDTLVEIHFFFLCARRLPLLSFAMAGDEGDEGNDGTGCTGQGNNGSSKPMTNADFRALLSAPRPNAQQQQQQRKKEKGGGSGQRRPQRPSRDGDAGSKYRYVVDLGVESC